MNIQPSLLTYFNPLSKSHNAWNTWKALPNSKKVIILVTSIAMSIFSLPIGGLGGVALFRYLVGRCKKLKAQNINPISLIKNFRPGILLDIPLKEAEIAPLKEAQIKEKKDGAKDFQNLLFYIKRTYPAFDTSKYFSVGDLQNSGHPYHFAVQHADRLLIDYLGWAEGDIDQTDAQGSTALLFACQNPQLGIKTGNARGISSTFSKANGGASYKTLEYVHIIEHLLKRGANPLKKNNSGEFPLKVILKNQLQTEVTGIDIESIFKKLIESHKKDDLISKMDELLPYIKENSSLYYYLIQSGVIKEDSESSLLPSLMKTELPFHKIVKLGNKVELVKKLVEIGKDINAVDENGTSALLLACEAENSTLKEDNKNSPDIPLVNHLLIIALVEQGADLLQEDNKNKKGDCSSPFSFLLKYRPSGIDILDLLKKHEANGALKKTKEELLAEKNKARFLVEQEIIANIEKQVPLQNEMIEILKKQKILKELQAAYLQKEKNGQLTEEDKKIKRCIPLLIKKRNDEYTELEKKKETLELWRLSLSAISDYLATNFQSQKQ